MNSLGEKKDGQDAMSRQLVWIPIVHTREDLGRLGARVEEAFVRRLGRSRWESHQKSIEALWERIKRRIEEMKLDLHRVRLYQDGLPVCGQEEAIVREVSTQGSRNHQLLADLIDRGATLMGTESPQLLIQEYQLNRRILDEAPGGSLPGSRAEAIRDEAARLLESRDRFIAGRIAETLQPGETGLVFLGMLHSLKGRLPDDISMTVLRPD